MRGVAGMLAHGVAAYVRGGKGALGPFHHAGVWRGTAVVAQEARIDGLEFGVASWFEVAMGKLVLREAFKRGILYTHNIAWLIAASLLCKI